MGENDISKKEVIEIAFLETPPSRFTETRTWLGEFYETLKNKLNNKYSYLEFASDLGFSATNVVFLMIRGKRALSLKSAQRIGESIGLPAREMRYFLLMAQYENEKSAHERERIFSELVELRGRFELSKMDRAQLRFFTEWYHPVVRELVGLPHFNENPEWIASQTRPRIRPRQAEESLALLEELQLIRRNGSTGRYEQTEKHITTGDEVSSLSIVRFHQKMIELGKDSITDINENERDVSAIQIPANEALLEKIKSEVRAFRKHIIAICENEKECERVLQLNIQLFPVTEQRRK